MTAPAVRLSTLYGVEPILKTPLKSYVSIHNEHTNLRSCCRAVIARGNNSDGHYRRIWPHGVTEAAFLLRILRPADFLMSRTPTSLMLSYLELFPLACPLLTL